MARARVNICDIEKVENSLSTFLSSIENVNQSLSNLKEVSALIEKEAQNVEQSQEKCEQNLNILPPLLDTANSNKNTVNTKLSQYKSKLASLNGKLSRLKALLKATPKTIKGRPNPAYLALEAEIVSVEADIATTESRIAKCESVLSSLDSLISDLESEIEKNEAFKEKTTEALEELRRCLNELNKCIDTISNNCNACSTTSKDAQNCLNRAKMCIENYLSINCPGSSSSYSLPSFDISYESMVEPIRAKPTINLQTETGLGCSNAIKGANEFLQEMGVNVNKLLDAQTDDEKIQIISAATDDPRLIKQYLAIANHNYLPDDGGGFQPFYSTNNQTAGDSVEWFKFFEQKAQGKIVKKEVHFDLSKYQGKTMDIFGVEEKIHKPYRATDVVVYDGNKEIHQELKVGLWGKNLRDRIRDELYADKLRLDSDPNSEQEYRIYKNERNKKSLFNDKEQGRYLYIMKKLYPSRVRIYNKDQELSLEELERIIGDQHE